MLANDPGKVRETELQQRDLHRLIKDRGLKRYGLFFVTGEGKVLPDGSENASGYVVDERGRVFFFWLDWDARRRRIALTEWQEVAPGSESDWEGAEEYQAARRAAGIRER